MLYILPPQLRVIAALLLVLSPIIGAHAAESQSTRVQVRIEGIDGVLLENVRRFLSITQLTSGFTLPGLGRNNAPEVTPAEVRRRHFLARRQISEALVPYGYYRPRVTAELQQKDDGYVATYRIDAGAAAMLEQVRIDVSGAGAEHPAVLAALAGDLPQPGQALSHPAYTKAKERLFDAAYDSGFLDARWRSSEIAVAPNRLSADITLHLDTGPQYYFGPVQINQSILSRDFVSRFVQFTPGQPYDVTALLRLQRDLNLSGYFSRVEIEAPRDKADSAFQVPVVVDTEPTRPQKYSLGLGYGTDTGPRTRLDALWRRINSRGHRLSADMHASALEQGIGSRYEIPIRNVARDSFALSATARTEDIGDATADRFSIRAEHSTDWLGFRRTLYVASDRETFEFDTVAPREVTLVYPGVALARERANDAQFPTRAYGLRMDLRFAGEALLTEVSFVRFAITGRWTRGLGQSTRLLLGAQAGALWTDDFDLLPPSHRFFTGGDRSIRGYAFEEVAPRNAGNDVIGGRRLITGSVELEHMFWRKWGGALFVDAGDAFNNTPDIKVGAGLGLRWRSPVGVVRLDIAHPFDDDGTDFRFHFTIGAHI